jgi:hypothetical protein
MSLDPTKHDVRHGVITWDADSDTVEREPIEWCRVCGGALVGDDPAFILRNDHHHRVAMGALGTSLMRVLLKKGVTPNLNVGGD